MPKFVCDALVETDLVDAYGERPAYQQNDYIWVDHARQEGRYARLTSDTNAG